MTHDWNIQTSLKVRTVKVDGYHLDGRYKYLHLRFETDRYLIQANSEQKFFTKDEALFALIKGRITWDVRETKKPKRMDKH